MNLCENIDADKIYTAKLKFQQMLKNARRRKRRVVKHSEGAEILYQIEYTSEMFCTYII